MSKKEIRANYIYNLLCEIVTTMLAFLIVPYISRTLGTEGYGLFTHVTNTGLYFVMFSKLGIATHGNRLIAQYRDDKEKINQKYSSLFYFQAILTTVMLLIYILFVVFIQKEYKTEYIIYTISIASTLFFVLWFFKGIEHFKIIVINTMIFKFLSFALIFLFVKTESDVDRYVMIESVTLFLSYAAFFISSRRYVKLVRVKLHDIAAHFKPCLILFVPILAQSIYRIMDKIMIGNMSDMLQLGYYQYAEILSTAMIGLITSFGTVMLPRISNMIHKGRKKETEVLIEQGMNIAMFFGSAVAFGIGAVANEFVILYYGPANAETVRILYVLLPTVLFLAWANVIRTHYIIPNHRDYVFVITICSGAAINLILNTFLIPRYQAIGAAVGTLCAEGTVVLLQICLIRGSVKFFRLFMKNVIYLIAGVVMFISVRKVAGMVKFGVLGLFIEILVGVCVYLLICGIYHLLRKIFKKKDVNEEV